MATINARIDDDIKNQADEVLKQLNISQTQAIAAFYQYIAEQKKLPFVISTIVKTPHDLLRESSDMLAEALAVISNLQAWTEQPDGIAKTKLMEYYRRLDALYCCAKEKISLTDNRDAELALNAFNKAMSILVDAENFGYGYEKVTFSKLEQTNFELAVSMFRTKISWLITETLK
ncbi:type II toxin-antitoxin system RelB/DinJ family antitoxin [Salmonella enterica subsp. enterica]|nr:type II toxin-antitoxin system RelB/DinJ family antitoxin [Salmonella enterica]EBY6677913.1 type II toxin-antitoxin system RelB/DinJ family antitoxin [Salmonella enterica subsp. enterica serovar Saphra]EDV1282231.1 type II toxin-antitoxin system RelB/DinJ family antitoxin [Salmonella enterica subsp. enterica]EEN5143281.1 type II toxin-antitoxin system RelB/DinJ family antitoxin [Salmonella enterica subsp. enterica serovar Oranienburg]EEP8162918.1 type II toxin-antitoxin system RelB/DinJ fami